MDPITRLEASLDLVGPVIDGIARANYDHPTPCPSWNVGQLINHLLGLLTMFRDVALDCIADPAVLTADLIGSDATKSFEQVGRAVVDLWQQPYMLIGTAELPTGHYPAEYALEVVTAAVLVHGWDLAVACGQRPSWTGELIIDTLAFCEQTYSNPRVRGRDFAPPVPVASGASDLHRLVAFLGRDPR